MWPDSETAIDLPRFDFVFDGLLVPMPAALRAEP